ncbi:MAG: pilus assembly protein PilO [Nevskiaceae bacterium]|nr:MAG: pilus assembly protein PilO [Nevskiaceae bacterium]
MNLQQLLSELQSLDAKNPGAWPLWARIAAVVLLSIAILVAGFVAFIKPQLDDLDQEQAKEQTLREDFVKKQEKVAALDAYKAQLEEMRKSFGSMLRQLPSKTEVASLLNDISQTRIASNLEEELFKPQAEVPKDFYAEIPNQITVLGTYHQLGTFVSGIAALPRIVTIDDVEIRLANGKAGDKSSPNLLRMQAYAKTYRYLDDDEIGAQKSNKPGAAGKAGGAK